ncbi:MAG: DUF2147 domain-containing protein [Xanthobacteraceae bacterium]
MLQSLRFPKRTLVYCGLVLAAGMTSAVAGDPTGDWRVEDGVAHIRVAACQGSMWGAVAWEKVAGGRDKNNPDAAMRSRPTLGMPILLDMKRTKASADQWEGKIYNAKDGKLYDSTMTLNSPNELEIEGCVLGILCGGQTWTRVSGPIPPSPSDNAAASAKAPAAKGPAPKHAGKAPPRTVGQKGAAASTGTGEAADPVGDICLLPDIARTTH